LGTPEPCTTCHQDRTPAWAAAEIAARYPEGRGGTAHHAHAFAKADGGDVEATAELIQIANDPNYPDLVRASALQRLGRIGAQVSAANTARWLKDESPYLRRAAVPLTASLSGEQRTQLLVPLLRDPVRSVRVQTAKRFLDLAPQSLDARAQAALRSAMGELQRSMAATADFPEVQVAIGGVALALRNFNAASSAFARATQMDPQLVDAWVMRARIDAAMGNAAAARQTLRQAIAVNPDNDILRQMLAEIAEG
jgi:tetratricopeptide (TPR) repeat protein